MTCETRYMRGDTQTVNGLLAFILGTAQSNLAWTYTDSGSDNPTVSWGIRVWKRASDGTETEITAGTPVAGVGRGSTGSGIQSNTWVCPQTALALTDAIVVRVYSQVEGSSWNLKATFITEQLGVNQLDSATWTVYYYTTYLYNEKLDLFSASFRHGTATYNSRIENFCYSYVIPPTVQAGLHPSKPLAVILTE